MDLTPDSYPARCELDQEQLTQLHVWITTEDNGKFPTVDEWPPTDLAGNVLPIFFDDLDDLTDRGRLYDSNYNEYRPFAGNKEPIIDHVDYEVCNAPLNNWRERYPSIRYCGSLVVEDVERDYCYPHRNREHVMKSAEEHMQAGLYAQSLDHVYEKLDAWKRLLGWGMYESLMAESQYEFGPDPMVREFDFSDCEFEPPETDENGILEAEIHYPTEHTDAALSLYAAAMMGVQMITVQPRIMFEDRENGQGMMEEKQVEHAQLTAPPSEHDPSPQEYKTLETWGSHHLNLAFSRLITDRPKLLERGGVDPSADDTDSDGVSADEIVLDVSADPETVETSDDTGTDPNAFENYESESERIVENIEDSTESST